MRYLSLSLVVCVLLSKQAWAVDKPIAMVGKPTTATTGAAISHIPIAGLSDTQIQSISVSSNAVNLTGATASVSVTVNSQHGPCAADVLINGNAGATMYTVDSNPPVGNAIGYSGTLTFNAPGSYDILAKKSSWVGPGCSGQAKTTIKVSADANWPCSSYGFVKQTGGFLGAGQFICVAPNTPTKVATMNCPSGTVFFNFGAMFGCVSQATANAFFKLP